MSIYSLVMTISFFLLKERGFELENYIGIASQESEFDAFLSYSLMMSISFLLTFHFEKTFVQSNEMLDAEIEKTNSILQVMKIGSWEFDFITNSSIWSEEVYNILF